MHVLDPTFSDAPSRARSFSSTQLDTFAAWAGHSSDISFYLNSHHIDFHCWAMLGMARPETVTALGSDGVADARLGRTMEDTITLAVQWRNCNRTGSGRGGGGAAEAEATEAAERTEGAAAGGARKRARAVDQQDSVEGAATPRFVGSAGHATYTSSWIAPKSDVHSQQRWFYMGHAGEITVDQAHRGYSVATDAGGYQSVNPLFWKPARNALTKEFAGQRTYGYLSFEAFVDAAARCNAKAATPSEYDGALPTMATTAAATAILEAGRLSLDAAGRPFALVYESETAQVPVAIRPVQWT